MTPERERSLLAALSDVEEMTTVALVRRLDWANDGREVAPRLTALQRRGLVERTTWRGYGYDTWLRTAQGTERLRELAEEAGVATPAGGRHWRTWGDPRADVRVAER